MSKKEWLITMVLFYVVILIPLIPLMLYSDLSGNWMPTIIVGGAFMIIDTTFVIYKIVYENKHNSKNNTTECFITEKEIEILRKNSKKRFYFYK